MYIASLSTCDETKGVQFKSLPMVARLGSQIEAGARTRMELCAVGPTAQEPAGPRAGQDHPHQNLTSDNTAARVRCGSAVAPAENASGSPDDEHDIFPQGVADRGHVFGRSDEKNETAMQDDNNEIRQGAENPSEDPAKEPQPDQERHEQMPRLYSLLERFVQAEQKPPQLLQDQLDGAGLLRHAQILRRRLQRTEKEYTEQVKSVAQHTMQNLAAHGKALVRSRRKTAAL